jgi:hypothetical protein
MALAQALAKVSIELIAIYFHSFEIFNIQIGEMAFYKTEYSKRRMFFWMILNHSREIYMRNLLET